MKKKIISLLMILAMMLAVSACGSKDQDTGSGTDADTKQSEPVSGGWELYDNEANVLPEEVQTAFDKAAEQYVGSDLKPLAYIASQVVAGTNYMILCEAETVTEEPVKSYQMVVVYADLEGNAEITQVKDFDLTAYVNGDSTEISAEQLAGGWTVATEKASSVIPQDAKDVFDKAAAGFTGSELEPMVLLGTQVVAGTNYAFLCYSTLQTEETVNGIQVVTVYADLEGNAEITGICTVDPADFSE